MISNKVVSILHPQIKVVGWAMKQMLHLADFLQNDNTVTFYTFLWDSKYVSQNDSFSIYSSFSSYPLKLLSFFIIAWKVRKSDYIFCWNSPMHFVAWISRIFFRSKAKMIWWHHHYPWYYGGNTGIKTYFKKIIESYVVGQVDTIVWNSRFLQKELQDIYKREIKILYPLIDDIFYKAEVLKKTSKKWKIIFVAGRWDKWKWLDDIFDLYETLKWDINLSLYIAWEWTELSEKEILYKDDLKLSFLGQLWLEQMKENFEKADVFLFLSKIDSFGLVIVESLLSWTPVISYNMWEAPFLIQEWESGHLCENFEDCIKKLSVILTDDEKLQSLQSNAKKSVVSNYSMKHFEQQLEEIIFEK